MPQSHAKATEVTTDYSFRLGTQGSTGVVVDLSTLLRTRMLIQANSGGGKSWAIRRLLEQSHGKIQQIVFDVEGEFGTLRENFDYILVGPGGDIATDTRTAAVLAERLLELKASAIIDLFELHKSERPRYVKQFLSAMISVRKELWTPCMVVLDEAHHFAPEKGDCEAQEAVIDLCTRGRKRQFAAVLATQRLSALAKSAAAECNNVLIGRTTLDIDVRRAAETLQFTVKDAQKLRALRPGHFYSYGPAISDAVVEVEVGAVQTTHPDFGRSKASLISPPPRAKIIAVLSKLEDLPKVATEREQTLETLRTRVRDLEQKVRSGKAADTHEAVELRRRAETAEAAVGRLRTQLWDIRNWLTNFVEVFSRLTPIIADIRVSVDAAKINLRHIENSVAPPVELAEKARPETPLPPPSKKTPSAGEDAETSTALRSGAMKMLKVAAMFYPDVVSKQRIATLAGFSVKGGTFNTYLSELLRRQWLEKSGWDYIATKTGVTVVGDVEPLSTDPRVLLDMWKRSFRAGVGRILDALFAAGGELTKDRLAVRAEFEPTGGTFSTYMSELRRNHLIVVEGDRVRLIDELSPNTVSVV